MSLNLPKEKELLNQLASWVAINSYSKNLPGIKTMASKLVKDFSPLGATLKYHPAPPLKRYDENGRLFHLQVGDVLTFRKRPDAPIQLLLGGHIDTVFPKECPFQEMNILDKKKATGPGIIDMKGGLLVMFYALLALEKSANAHNIGWEVVINSDEELGSPFSQSFLKRKAGHYHAGLWYEPSLPGGLLARERSGSATYLAIASGIAAHAGRDFHSGKNAILALTPFIQKAAALSNLEKQVTLNVGYVKGGEAVNVVPDRALCRLNVRAHTKEEMKAVDKLLHQFAKELDITLHQETVRPPKIVSKETEILFEAMQQCGEAVGITLDWQDTGGVCDGNALADGGLPILDTLGVVGTGLHTYDETLHIPSLLERTRLSALFLQNIASGQLLLPHKKITKVTS